MRNKTDTKKKIVLFSALLIVFISIGMIISIKFVNGDNDISASANTNVGTDDNKEVVKEPEKPKLDNSGYTTLEEDPNAEDAHMVSETINGLLTGTKTFPVRTDGKKVVYLTFDDGPSTTNTPKILDILKENNIKGTFFTIGTSIDKNEEAKDILKRTAKEGHAIANHTYSHDYKYLYPSRIINVDNFMDDIEKNNQSLKNVLGKDFSTRVIRFPGGYWSWNGRVPMKERMIAEGICNIEWNALNKDAEGAHKNAAQLVQETKNTVEALGPNADFVVLLMHDTYGKEETVKALPQIIEYFKSKGFEFKTMK